MSKGKSRTRGARSSVLKAFAVANHRRDKERAKRRYDRRQYDGYKQGEG